MLNRALSGTILILILAFSALAQKEKEKPRSFLLPADSLQQVDRKVMKPIDPKRLLEADKQRGKEGPLRFAVAEDAAFDLKNSGTWQTLPGGRLWRLRIHTPGAISHNLGITRFNLPEGAKLWIYDPGRKHVEGPYTQKNRSNAGSLWTPIIEGDEIVVELFVPDGADGQPSVLIGKVNKGYTGFGKVGLLGGSAGLCNIDVVCPEGNPWANQIRAITAYTINGTSACTGNLINNTRIDFTPYVLSANHCGVTATTAATIVAFWNFQSATCGTHGPGNTTDNQTGATFRSTSAASDFVLFELDDRPNDLGFNAFHVGWDRTGTAPPGVTCIHHPRADVKSISFANTPPTISGNFWRANWDVLGPNPPNQVAITEPGSSGSCIFENDTGRCIGMLSNGPSFCGATAANLHDFYGRFDLSWTGGGTNATRLSNWLDPDSTGVSSMDGDTHITTANGTRYDFQGAGEFISVRDADGLEIQTRMTPVGTSFTPGADPYSGIATCVSINSAVAARVGSRRVTIQPNISGVPDPSGLQVRVDGALTTVGAGGVALGSDARIDKIGDAFQVRFPNGTMLVVTPLFWSDQGKWYLNVEVLRSGTYGMDGGSPGGGGVPGGLMAALAPGSWLPALSDGTSLGPMPSTMHQRFVDLYQRLGESWRVTNSTSLFDYGPGTSTETFTDRGWPRENGPCNLPANPPVRRINAEVARRLCRAVADKGMNANCVFDVINTGEPGFAKLYLLKQRMRNGFTNTAVEVSKDPVPYRERITFTATVVRRAGGVGVPGGTVQFTLDGRNLGEPVRLDKSGRARWTSPGLQVGKYQIRASYAPGKDSPFTASSGRERVFTVTER
jgi:hypothetical protein